MSFVAVDPTTGETIATHPFQPPEAVAATVAAAAEAFASWRATPIAERAALLTRAAALLRERKEELAERMVAEVGKPIREARGEVEKCAWVCEYYAERGAGFLAPEPVDVGVTASYVAYEPLGVVLAIMPWNFPFWQVFRCAAPALVAGDAVLLKHAPSVPGCAQAIEALLRDAGAPTGVFQNLFIDTDAVPGVLASPAVAAVTFTGSVAGGRAVAQAAGAALTKAVLELGGSDPYLILEDADLDQAAAECATSRLVNSGQSCIAAKRIVVVEAVREAFEQALVARMKEAVVGDPRDEATAVGPLARADLRANLHRQIEASVAAGARLLLGGTLPDGPGFFYPPTILTDTPPGCPARTEELFGPATALIPVADEAEGLAVANDTAFGLGAAVFTADRARGERIAREGLQAGACFVNAFVRSDPRLPFGGVRGSGFGRELGRAGIRELVNVKTVYVG